MTSSLDLIRSSGFSPLDLSDAVAAGGSFDFGKVLGVVPRANKVPQSDGSIKVYDNLGVELAVSYLDEFGNTKYRYPHIRFTEKQLASGFDKKFSVLKGMFLGFGTFRYYQDVFLSDCRPIILD